MQQLKGGTGVANRCEDSVVADPKLMGKTGILVGGQPSDRVFDDVVDFVHHAPQPSSAALAATQATP